MRVYCVGYRKWAIDIYKYFYKNSSHRIKICVSKRKFSIKKIIKFKPDYVLFYGWSSKVTKKLTDNFYCIMLHPSPLPKYRGGSPIQNQIINNVKKTKVTLFKMTEKFDDGPILADKSISLEGHLEDIFRRLTETGIFLTKKIFKGQFVQRKQSRIKTKFNKSYSIN